MPAAGWTSPAPTAADGEASAEALTKLSTSAAALTRARPDRTSCFVDTATSSAPDSESHARLMMALFMGSWSIGFLALIAAHLYFRLDALVWPPSGAPPPPRLLTGLSTLVAVASSVVYHRAYTRARADHPGLGRGLLTASGLAALFMLMQVAAGAQAVARGLVWDASAYAAFFWITAGFHLAHVLVGFVAGFWLWQRQRARELAPGLLLQVELWGYYWHSIGLMWILIYLVVFLA